MTVTYETTPQLAQRWGVSRGRIIQFIREGRLFAQKQGRDWIITGFPERRNVIKKRWDHRG